MKKLLIILFAALWVIPGVASAHSKLETAVPEKDSTVAVSPRSIELTYNTKIENLSNLKLLNEAGEQIATDKAVVDGDTMRAAVPAVLSNGVYTVKWTIIGADGHSVEGEYHFTVRAAESSAAPEPTSAPEATDEATTAPAAETSETVEPSETAAQGTDSVDSEASGGNGTVIAAIVIGAIIAAAAAVLLARRRK